MRKQYIGISRDHSGSMNFLANAAKKDYNATIAELKEASNRESIDTIVSVVSHQGSIKKEVQNSSVAALQPLTSYPTPGSSTPLFKSIETLIDMLEDAPDATEDVTFLIIAVTDGLDNVSSLSDKEEFSRRLRQLQATDRWTFVFRVPHGYKKALVGLGVPEGNIQEWEQTERGMQESTVQTTGAISNYYSGISRGLTSSKTFYADLSRVSQNKVASRLVDISGDVKIFPVSNKTMISPFLTLKTRKEYIKGTGFYQLTKSEKLVQDYKLIVVRNKKFGTVYAGLEARQLLSLPISGNIKLAPGDHGDWDIFVQSTSMNRFLLPGTSVLYWPNPTRL